MKLGRMMCNDSPSIIKKKKNHKRGRFDPHQSEYPLKSPYKIGFLIRIPNQKNNDLLFEEHCERRTKARYFKLAFSTLSAWQAGLPVENKDGQILTYVTMT